MALLYIIFYSCIPCTVLVYLFDYLFTLGLGTPTVPIRVG